VEYCGNFYGTPKAYVEEQLKEGRIVLLEIEVKGACSIKKQYPECVSIFIAPPDLDELKKRIINRGTEPLDVIEERMRRAEKEMEHISEYDYVVINDTVENSSNKLLKILELEIESANKRTS
ncbi:MAG TPA: guanylate kinase, partial [Clostridia bacterium]